VAEKGQPLRCGGLGSPGKPHGSEAVEPLIAALRDVDSNVRSAAADALGEIGDSWGDGGGFSVMGSCVSASGGSPTRHLPSSGCRGGNSCLAPTQRRDPQTVPPVQRWSFCFRST
jgi:hypothetical protein